MKHKIFNEDILKDEDMDGSVVRVKAFIINNNDEVIMASSNGGVQLIGGHVEDGESEVETLKREILEEAGIEVSNEEISKCFYEIRHYAKNYYNSGKNVLSIIHYYLVHTDKSPNLDKVHRTSQEKRYEFSLKQIPFNSLEDFLKGFLDNEKEVNRIIAAETIEAFKNIPELRDLYDINSNKTDKTYRKGDKVPEGYYPMVVMVVIRNSKGEFLMQKRVESKGGDWGVTGGHPKSGETPIEGIITEVKEELGLDFSNEKFIEYDSGCDGKDCYKMYFVTKDIDINDIKIQKEELTEVRWFTMDELKSMVDSGELNEDQIACFNKVCDYLNKK